MVKRWLERRRDRRNCFHHNLKTRESWIRQSIIDYRKFYVCTHCERGWVI